MEIKRDAQAKTTTLTAGNWDLIFPRGATPRYIVIESGTIYFSQAAGSFGGCFKLYVSHALSDPARQITGDGASTEARYLVNVGDASYPLPASALYDLDAVCLPPTMSGIPVFHHLKGRIIAPGGFVGITWTTTELMTLTVTASLCYVECETLEEALRIAAALK